MFTGSAQYWSSLFFNHSKGSILYDFSWNQHARNWNYNFFHAECCGEKVAFDQICWPLFTLINLLCMKCIFESENSWDLESVDNINRINCFMILKSQLSQARTNQVNRKTLESIRGEFLMLQGFYSNIKKVYG